MESKHQFRISQSALRDFNKTFSDRKESWRQCQYAWIQIYVKGNRVPPVIDPPSAMTKGLWFEERVIGANRDGDNIEFPRNTQGEKFKYELDLEENVKLGVKVIQDLGIEVNDVQPEWIHEDLSGHLDALITYEGREAIMDLKYTEVKETDRFKMEFQWADPEEKDHIQAIHYVYLGWKKYGKWFPFYYLVIGKSGWVKWIKVVMHQNAILEHENKIEKFREDFKTFKPQPCGQYNICRKCPYKLECPEPTLVPEEIVINVE